MKLSTAQFVHPGPTERSQPGRKLLLARSFDTARTRCAPTVYQWSAPAMANGSYGWPCLSLASKAGIIACVGQPALASCTMADTLPSASNAMRTCCSEGERGESKRASSARVQIILTGRPMACAASAAGTQ
ncbi:hypothetical protein JaAD80_25830 [Janthinobacterium sp. AD80]|nr:hypothetical protein JaAD80_25830 [Janthinobacterium sp. AD80]